MDARITKQRLGNLLSYDWLKILGVIAAAVLLLYVIFVMIAARPTVVQVFTVYTYGARTGADGPSLAESLDGKFSYDILKVEMQNFEDSAVGQQALSVRRSALEGDVVIVANYTEEENGLTPFERIAAGYSHYNPEDGTCDGYYEIPAFLTETEQYLQDYFGNGLSGEPDETAVMRSFARIGASDKRFRTDAQKEAGLAGERARVKALRDNYLFVKAAFDGGSLYTVDYTFTYQPGSASAGEAAKMHYPFGIGLGNLTGLTDLFRYSGGGSAVNRELVLLFFDNGNRAEDAKYENWAFLRYLLETYAPVHS